MHIDFGEYTREDFLEIIDKIQIQLKRKDLIINPDIKITKCEELGIPKRVEWHWLYRDRENTDIELSVFSGNVSVLYDVLYEEDYIKRIRAGNVYSICYRNPYDNLFFSFRFSPVDNYSDFQLEYSDYNGGKICHWQIYSKEDYLAEKIAEEDYSENKMGLKAILEKFNRNDFFEVLKNFIKEPVQLNETQKEEYNKVLKDKNKLIDSSSVAYMNEINKIIGKQDYEKFMNDFHEDEIKITYTILKTFLFIFGYHNELTKDLKKNIISFVNKMYKKSLSLFEVEDEINNFVNQMQGKKSQEVFEKNFFEENLSREYAMEVFGNTYILLSEFFPGSLTNSFYMQVRYNFYLMKKQFNFSRKELVEIYTRLADINSLTVDDIAEDFEEFIGEIAVEKILRSDFNIGEFNVVNQVQIEEREKQLEQNKLLQEQKQKEQKIAEQKQKIAEQKQKIAEQKKESDARIMETIKNTYHSFIKNVPDVKDQFYYLDENPKVVANAIKSYAKGSSGENALFQWDESLFGNGKVGFLLTDKNIYFCNSFSNPDVCSLLDIESFSAKGNVIVANGKTIYVTSQTEAVKEFLNDILPLVKKL